ncbi:F420-nonreducing hydrogenase [Metallumcola ferriviriculae]|uniref:F420-nonreducing hydrogenase n=1 Tax=Metallumcola ferriviriculae TaxID=3039180 RepID=A0AAU0UJM4_9FIRM|nr:F420-nonreducing hydrogenase [Desulfitibacteraceae bacterium MK1]
MSKKTVATAWLQGCSGCHISILDLHQELVELLGDIEILSSPLVDIKEFPRVDICLVEGAVGTEGDVRKLQELRQKSDVLVALGTCACFGGISGLRNLYKKDEVLEHCYTNVRNVNKNGTIPSSEDVPALLESVKPVGELAKIDYQIPGCPPLPGTIKTVLQALITGKEPVLPQRSLCAECDREQRELLKPTREFIADSVVAFMELEEIDPVKCFLEQGVLCMGLATREGCHARCLKGNVPCRGCMGPTPGAMEQGAKLINSLASVLPAGGLMFMEDIVGTGYRYSMPSSIIPNISRKEEEIDE